MKLEEAIAKLELHFLVPKAKWDKEATDALKLGIEALKRIIHNRQLRGGKLLRLLPGERQ